MNFFKKFGCYKFWFLQINAFLLSELLYVFWILSSKDGVRLLLTLHECMDFIDSIYYLWTRSENISRNEVCALKMDEQQLEFGIFCNSSSSQLITELIVVMDYPQKFTKFIHTAAHTPRHSPTNNTPLFLHTHLANAACKKRHQSRDWSASTAPLVAALQILTLCALQGWVTLGATFALPPLGAESGGRRRR